MRSEDDLVLVDLLADGTILAQSVPGYVSPGILLLPLGQVTEALEFPIQVSAREGVAQGWSFNKDNQFSLDLARHEAIVGGSKETIGAALAELHDDDIYVDTTLLGKWFSLQLHFSFATQTVTVVPQNGVQLPFQIAAGREKRKEALAGSPHRQATDYPVVRAPYSLATLPFVDVTTTTGFDQHNQKPFQQSASALATGDLLWMHSDTFLNYEDTQGINNLRFTLSRRDPDSQLFAADEAIAHTWLGEAADALELREVAAGDIYSSLLPLTARNQSGRGVTISNQPADRVTPLDRTTLKGNTLPGWQIELYRNDELLAFQQASSNGQYEFLDVPLLAGLNLMRLVFYGPYGETREEVQRILVTGELTKAGTYAFRATAMQQNNSLLDLRRQQPRPLAEGSLVGAAEGQERVALEYEYGLADNLAFFGHLAHLPTADGVERDYATIGAGTSLAGVYGRVDASTSSDGGHALQANLQTHLFGVTLAGTLICYRDEKRPDSYAAYALVNR